MKLHLSFYDAQGRLLVSTRESDTDALRQTAADFEGEFVLPEIFKPMAYTVGDPSKPERLDNQSSILLASQVLGKSVGFSTIVPVIGRLEGYNTIVELERTRGPFQIAFVLNSSETGALLPSTSLEGVVQVDDAFVGTLERLPTGEVRLTLDVTDGQSVTIRRAGFAADILMAEGQDSFKLFLSTEVGHRFTIQAPCIFGKYVLPPGSYLVEAISPDTITLKSAKFFHPQLFDRELLLGVEIVEILGAGGPGR